MPESATRVVPKFATIQTVKYDSNSGPLKPYANPVTSILESDWDDDPREMLVKHPEGAPRRLPPGRTGPVFFDISYVYAPYVPEIPHDDARQWLVKHEEP